MQSSQFIVHYSSMMSGENVSNKIVQSLLDLVNMAKWLMNKNQQSSVTQELGRLFPSIRGRGWRGESSELLLRVGAGESSTLATDIIILVLQHGLPENGRSKKYWDQMHH